MRKVTVSRIRKRYAQTVLTFQITYVYVLYSLSTLPDEYIISFNIDSR